MAFLKLLYKALQENKPNIWSCINQNTGADDWGPNQKPGCREPWSLHLLHGWTITQRRGIGLPSYLPLTEGGLPWRKSPFSKTTEITWSAFSGHKPCCKVSNVFGRVLHSKGSSGLWEAWTRKATDYPPGVTLALSSWGGVSGVGNKFSKALRD